MAPFGVMRVANLVIVPLIVIAELMAIYQPSQFLSADSCLATTVEPMAAAAARNKGIR